MSNSVGWFEIYVDDMSRARAFYESVIGVQLQKLEGLDIEMYSFPMDPEGTGSSGALVHTPGLPVGQNSVVIYFICDDCAVEESRVEAAGGRVEKSKFSIGPFGFVSLVRDTEGTMIGLHSMK